MGKKIHLKTSTEYTVDCPDRPTGKISYSTGIYLPSITFCGLSGFGLGFVFPFFLSSRHHSADAGACFVWSRSKNREEKDGCSAASHLPHQPYLLYHNVPAPSSSARKLFTQGNNYDKRIKIAWKERKHFTAEKKGNEAVKKTEHGARHRRDDALPLLQQDCWQRWCIFASAALIHCNLHWSSPKASESPLTEGLLLTLCLTQLSHSLLSQNQQVKMNSTYPYFWVAG